MTEFDFARPAADPYAAAARRARDLRSAAVRGAGAVLAAWLVSGLVRSGLSGRAPALRAAP
ncbi:hypothetical protein SAMN05444336_102307 [Albimonas donghaensis]|uniref:Uncharacterized protein n=1 Tax=Albimonas donghaensis TaxID=356660 RepID=A0A1H2W9L3_9RHOB|nr:hypothetical protein [Albimonas donghaensis]SDW77205.1 hypothetical protein SAMN05444336_102307 [Albimonas donghaensis]